MSELRGGVGEEKREGQWVCIGGGERERERDGRDGRGMGGGGGVYLHPRG